MSRFKGKTVIVTGHTGFKGAWLVSWLENLGAEVIGIGLDPPTVPSLYYEAGIDALLDDHRLDIRDLESLNELISCVQPDFIFHLAAQAIVGESYNSPLETISTNAIGTVNVLESLRTVGKRLVAVLVTSDKAYNNVEQIWGYRETDQVGGKDPYSASKGMAELAIRAYVESFFDSNESEIRIGVARAGNVIGGGDWSAGRIVPDCIRAWSNGDVAKIRAPNATRPWQHVLEPLSGYLALAMNLEDKPEIHGEAFNFGPPPGHKYSVKELVQRLAKSFVGSEWTDASLSPTEMFREAGLLKLDCEKADELLHWNAVLNFDETSEMTAKWYKHFYEKSMDMGQFTISQIEEYQAIALKRGLLWAEQI